MTGFVYAIQSGPLVKIGWSLDPMLRVSKIASDNPHGAKLLAFTAGSKEDEARLHSDFSDLRFRGEWFRFGASISERISVWTRPLKAPRRVVFTTPEVEEKAISLGASQAAVYKWRQRGVPPKWQLILGDF